MIHKMKLQNAPFTSIQQGKKDIEMRLFDEKRQKINVGDIIEFENVSTGEIICVSVVKLHLFQSFSRLYDAFDKERLGYEESEEAKPSDMEKYYPACEISEYGVVGIEIKLIKNASRD